MRGSMVLRATAMRDTAITPACAPASPRGVRGQYSNGLGLAASKVPTPPPAAPASMTFL